MRISLTHSKSEWILPNSGYQRLTAAFAGSRTDFQACEDQCTYELYLQRCGEYSSATYNSNSLSYFLIFMNPDFNLDWFKPMWYKGKENIKQIRPFSSYLPNPYVLLYEATNPAKKHSFNGNISANFTINRFLDLRLRFSVYRLRLSSRSSTDHGMTRLSLPVSSRSKTSLTMRLTLMYFYLTITVSRTDST